MSNKMFNKKVFIRTFGCQMNVSDSERMRGVLAESGYILAEDEEEADIILLNTCSVRQSAEQKVWSKLGKLHKQRGKEVILGLIGCMAQQYGDRVFNKAPYVNLVCGTYRFHMISESLLEACNGKKIVDIRRTEDDLGPVRSKPPSSPKAGTAAVVPKAGRTSNGVDRDGFGIRDSSVCAWVPISRGCDNKCSYCIVPFVRGPERNRSLSEIVDEVAKLAFSGYKEVTLLGQNVNSYKDGEYGFVDLLKKLNKIDGIVRIRFITSHPKDASIDLFRAIGELDKVCEHLHLPVQSGSNKILERMNRGYTREHYLDLISQVRRIIPDIAISTDIVVGFPGETEEDFQDTYNLMKEVEFDSAFIFKYSTRPGTPASDLPDDVVASLKIERNQCLIKLQDEISLRKNGRLIGIIQEVLVGGVSKNNKNRLMGRTRTNKIVVFEGEMGKIGQLNNIKINDATPYTLIGVHQGG